MDHQDDQIGFQTVRNSVYERACFYDSRSAEVVKVFRPYLLVKPIKKTLKPIVQKLRS